MKPLLDIAIRAALIWTAIGSVVWIILDQCSVVENGIEARRKKQGRPVTFTVAALASIAAILAWPAFVAVAIWNWKSAVKRLKRVVWR